MRWIQGVKPPLLTKRVSKRQRHRDTDTGGNHHCSQREYLRDRDTHMYIHVDKGGTTTAYTKNALLLQYGVIWRGNTIWQILLSSNFIQVLHPSRRKYVSRHQQFFVYLPIVVYWGLAKRTTVHTRHLTEGVAICTTTWCAGSDGHYIVI